MNSFLDTAERSAWTFAQAAAGYLAAADLLGAHVDWRQVLVAALVAGLVAVLKGLGVTAAQVRAVQAYAKAAAKDVPAVADVAAKVGAIPAVKTSEEVAAEVAAELIDGAK